MPRASTSNQSTIELLLPHLRRDQTQIALHPAKVKVLTMGRRWGKTVLGGAISLATAAGGGRVAWVVPTYRNGRALWRWAENTVAPVKMAGLCRVNRSERLIEFRNGGSLGVYSADSEDSVRGEAFHLVILDEAARIAESAWQDVLQPTLADYNGDAILISTPKGRNWFYNEFQRALDDRQYAMAWQAPSAHNPIVSIQNAARKARDLVPERTYRQEWLAEFVEDGGFFRNIEARATIERADLPGDHAGHHIVMGVDWAKIHDWTVLTALCRDCGRVVDWDRFNKIDYHYQRERLKVLSDRWGVKTILAESNSIGEPNIEELRRAGLPVVGFATTSTTKPALIEGLGLALETNAITIPLDYMEELRAFEVETRRDGYPRYGAPAGMHDDRVISLALAWRACTAVSAGANYLEFLRIQAEPVTALHPVTRST